MCATVIYYEQHAKSFAAYTLNVDMSALLDRFLSRFQACTQIRGAETLHMHSDLAPAVVRYSAIPNFSSE